MKKIDTAVLAILDGAKIDGNVVRLTGGQLDRKMYEAVNKVLADLGGKWNRKFQGHVFADEPAEILESAILTGEYSNKKQDFGFFETPLPLARKVHELADLHTGHSILEPSAGRGALLDPLPKDTFRIQTIEILSENASALKAKGYPCEEADFLSLLPIPYYDRIIMNPPFAKQADIDHVARAFKCLKRGGRLVSIMSAGVLFRDNRKTAEFRQNYPGEYMKNPDESFKTSGTMVNTITVVLQK